MNNLIFCDVNVPSTVNITHVGMSPSVGIIELLNKECVVEPDTTLAPTCPLLLIYIANSSLAATEEPLPSSLNITY